jgi:putative SOS response-associated peptidase YedK
MCGRYEIHAHPEVVAMQFALGAAPEFKKSYNVCPGGEILTVRLDREGQRVARHNRWGSGNKLANARGETVAERPAFREAFRRWRCLVPASGFYEWQAVAGRKQPWHFRPTDAELFALAGITAIWNGIRSVSLITTEPNVLMAPIHDRMPVILKPEDYAAWLDTSNHDAQALIRPYPAERMAARPVSMRVNQPENDDPELIEETKGPLQRGLL